MRLGVGGPSHERADEGVEEHESRSAGVDGGVYLPTLLALGENLGEDGGGGRGVWQIPRLVPTTVAPGPTRVN